MIYLEVGQITKTHGINGEVRVKIITDNINRFEVGNVLYVGEAKEKIIINSFRLHKNMGLLKFNDYNNINDVLKYVKNMIYTEKDNIILPNEYYYDDLINCHIVVDSKKIGLVYDIMEVPQGIILMVKLLDNQNKLIPFIDEFIGFVDLDEKTIEVNPIEGLL